MHKFSQKPNKKNNLKEQQAIKRRNSTFKGTCWVRCSEFEWWRLVRGPCFWKEGYRVDSEAPPIPPCLQLKRNKQWFCREREREGDEESEEEKGKVVNAMCVGLVLFGFGLVGRILVPSDFYFYFLNGDGLFFVINTFASFFVFFFFFLYNRYWVLSKGL